MMGTLRPRKNIRRFTDDILSQELRSSIHEMAKNITREVSMKVTKKGNPKIFISARAV